MSRREGKRGANGVPRIPVQVPIIEKPDPIGVVIAKQQQQRQLEEWGKAFEANAEAGAPQLLAFLMSGSVYNADTVYRVAIEILASMRAGGYLILKMTELRGLIEDAVRQVREGKEPTALEGTDERPLQFDAEGTLLEPDIHLPSDDRGRPEGGLDRVSEATGDEHRPPEETPPN